jgi:hypothetical protein
MSELDNQRLGECAADPRSEEVMLIRETRAVLETMLRDAGLNSAALATADVAATVEVFQRFASLPVERTAPSDEDGDGVLAQFGTRDLGGHRQFEVDLTRQIIEAGGSDAVMWQLSCTLRWSSSPQTDALASGSLWSFGRSLDEYFEDAVALPGWAWALNTSLRPEGLAIVLSEV